MGEEEEEKATDEADKKEKKEKKEKKGKGDDDDLDDRKALANVRGEEGTFAAVWQEGEEESDKNWLGGAGLKFHASGDKAFKMAAMKARENLEIFDPLASTGNSEIIADARKKRSEQLRPLSKRPKPEVPRW